MAAQASPLRSVALVRRHPDLAWTEFSRHWRENHAPLALSMPGMTAYKQGHAVPDDQIGGLPDDWRWDGCATATFPDLPAIAELRDFSDYRTKVMPDEAAFLDRAAMRAVLLTDGFGAQPEAAPVGSRTLMLFTATADAAAGRRLSDEVAVLAGEEPFAERWSVAVDADPGISPGGENRRPYDGLLELWFADRSAALRAVDALAAAPERDAVLVCGLLVQEHIVRAGNR